MREKLSEALKESLKARETLKVSTLRLILAAAKDREIALRGEDRTLTGDDILQIMQKMIRQRRNQLRPMRLRGGRIYQPRNVKKSGSLRLSCRSR